ncbi:hypothetical protein [Cellulomonas marina]|uniref:Uncharacterized protein n=1 Tax=Cellulomonas marina TaxID=988821 RepID=A0A1I1AM86_9CELL|nr:hypothetical protein [Cellulomonas marina]GIG30778.1 hypothetical protein Cma02nite_33780 [Cellulomonas marina]SFB37443.1 hypothetical protein SAMN05421867_11860 [Cellulomonas marina]
MHRAEPPPAGDPGGEAARAAHALLLAAVVGRGGGELPADLARDDAAALAVGLWLRDEAATILRAADRPDELLDAVRALLVAGSRLDPEPPDDGGMGWQRATTFALLVDDARGRRAEATPRLQALLVVDAPAVLTALAEAVAHVVRVHESPGGAAAYVRARAPRAPGR